MNLGEWVKDADGKVEVLPLVAFETLVAHGTLCGLRVHYLEEPAQLASGQSASLQLVMTPEMARQLADALIASAQEAQVGPTHETAH